MGHQAWFLVDELLRGTASKCEDMHSQENEAITYEKLLAQAYTRLGDSQKI